MDIRLHMPTDDAGGDVMVIRSITEARGPGGHKFVYMYALSTGSKVFQFSTNNGTSILGSETNGR